jgi:hypothetical protein
MVNHTNETQPEWIRKYVQLFFVSYAIGFLVNLFGWAPQKYYEQALGMRIFVGIGTILVMVFVVSMIAEGKNWARFFMLISAVIGMPFIVLSLPVYFNISILGGLMITLSNAVQVYCLYLLFCRANSGWFKKTPNVADSEATQGGE